MKNFLKPTKAKVFLALLVVGVSVVAALYLLHVGPTLGDPDHSFASIFVAWFPFWIFWAATQYATDVMQIPFAGLIAILGALVQLFYFYVIACFIAYALRRSAIATSKFNLKKIAAIIIGLIFVLSVITDFVQGYRESHPFWLSNTSEETASPASTYQAPVSIANESAPAGKEYVNILGYQLTLPSDWYLPASNDPDPHFYQTQACANSDQPDCPALEVQSQDSLANQSEQVFKEAKSEGRQPQKLVTLVPGATVIKALPQGGAEGWSMEYDVFFPQQRKAFVIFASNKGPEDSIISTLKLTK